MLTRTNHAGQHSRFSEPIIDHIERVASAVPPGAGTTALLHEILELTPVSPAQLRRHGISRIELKARQLLTHRPGEPYDQYVRRIADAPGPAGQLARP